MGMGIETNEQTNNTFDETAFNEDLKIYNNIPGDPPEWSRLPWFWTFSKQTETTKDDPEKKLIQAGVIPQNKLQNLKKWNLKALNNNEVKTIQKAQEKRKMHKKLDEKYNLNSFIMLHPANYKTVAITNNKGEITEIKTLQN